MSSAASAPAVPAAPAAPFRYVVTDGMADLLSSLGGTLAATTYQAGKLVLFRADRGGVSALFRTFDSAMGLALAGSRMAIGARNCIWILRDAPDIGRQIQPIGKHDACFVPRGTYITGDIRVHEMAWCRATGSQGEKGNPESPPELWFVNTRFSCMSTLDPDYCFVSRWRPKFISSLEPEDRCHLNGLALEGGRPAYVTALGQSDEREGWRANKAGGGVVIHVDSSEVVSTGLAMPHSPRLYDDRLFVLNSGHATLEVVDPRKGTRDTVARLPGYPRGLVFVDRYAFVGLSKIREKHEFGGLPIEQTSQPLRCGIACIDLGSGETREWIEFEAGCEEIFDVQWIPGARFATVVGTQKETLDGIYLLPPSAGTGQGQPA